VVVFAFAGGPVLREHTALYPVLLHPVGNRPCRRP
jgi:hypothetical protein